MCWMHPIARVVLLALCATAAGLEPGQGLDPHGESPRDDSPRGSVRGNARTQPMAYTPRSQGQRERCKRRAATRIFSDECSLTEVRDSSRAPGNAARNVTAVVFAGRRRYMRLLVRYLSVLLDDGRVSAVHLWDMTMDQADRIWLRHLSQLDGRYEVKGCKWDPEKPLWRYSCPYRYYAQAESFRDDDLLLKIDDDIVFMDLQRFGHFIDAVKEGHIYFPNIINNDVCAYIQSQLGVHQLLPDVPEGRTVAGFQGPLTKWSKNVTAALEIHSMFLNCPGSFRVGSNVTQVAWYSRVSINMMAMTWRTARRAFRAMLLAHRFVPFFEDEGFLTGSYVNTQLKGHSIPHYIVPGFTVSHFAFKKQRVDESDAALASQLAQYREVSKITSCLH